MSASAENQSIRHTPVEDLLALVAGCIFMALSVAFYRHAGLLTGGTTGLAFIFHYVSDWSLGVILFLVNLPFYVFSWLAMGPVFTLKTFGAVLGFSVMTEYMPVFLRLEYMDTFYAAIASGFLAGGHHPDGMRCPDLGRGRCCCAFSGAAAVHSERLGLESGDRYESPPGALLRFLIGRVGRLDLEILRTCSMCGAAVPALSARERTQGKYGGQRGWFS